MNTLHSDVRRIIELSAQADRLARLRDRKRITADEHNRMLAALREECVFATVELEPSRVMHD